MNTIKICAFADLHDFRVFYCHAPERLSAIQQHAEQVQADVVLHCGDLCHNAVESDSLLNQCAAFSMPFLHSLGNHECDGNSYDQILKAYGLDCGYYYRDIQGFRFIAYDSNHMVHHGDLVHFQLQNHWVPPTGIRDSETRLNALGTVQLEWLEQTIMSSPYPCVLFGHHSLIRANAGLIQEDREAVETMMRRVNQDKQRVLLVICGHHHVDYLSIQDNVPYFELNSASYYYGDAVEHQEFSPEIHAAHSEATHTLVWNDPLHAIITLSDEGHIRIEGMESDYYCGVSLKSLGLPLADPDGRLITPRVSSCEFTVNRNR